MNKGIFLVCIVSVLWSCFPENKSQSLATGINAPCIRASAQGLTLQEALSLKAQGRVAFHVTRAPNIPSILTTGLKTEYGGLDLGMCNIASKSEKNRFKEKCSGYIHFVTNLDALKAIFNLYYARKTWDAELLAFRIDPYKSGVKIDPDFALRAYKTNQSIKPEDIVVVPVDQWLAFGLNKNEFRIVPPQSAAVACLDPSGLGRRSFAGSLDFSQLSMTSPPSPQQILNAIPSDTCVPYTTITTTAGPQKSKVLQDLRHEASAAKSKAGNSSTIPEADMILGPRNSEILTPNTADFFSGTDGVVRYVKVYDDRVQTYSEHLANTIYRDIGLNAPDSSVFWHAKSQRFAFASSSLGKVDDIFDRGSLAQRKQRSREFLKGFVADVLIGNNNIMRESGDTVVSLDESGREKIYRLDSGSGFLMSSVGKRKNSNELKTISEWDDFQNPKINPRYAMAFQLADLTKVEQCRMFVSQWQRLSELSQSGPRLKLPPHQQQPPWESYLKGVLLNFFIADLASFRETVNMLNVRLKAIEGKLKELNCM